MQSVLTPSKYEILSQQTARTNPHQSNLSQERRNTSPIFKNQRLVSQTLKNSPNKVNINHSNSLTKDNTVSHQWSQKKLEMDQQQEIEYQSQMISKLKRLNDLLVQELKKPKKTTVTTTSQGKSICSVCCCKKKSKTTTQTNGSRKTLTQLKNQLANEQIVLLNKKNENLFSSLENMENDYIQQQEQYKQEILQYQEEQDRILLSNQQILEQNRILELELAQIKEKFSNELQTRTLENEKYASTISSLQNQVYELENIIIEKNDQIEELLLEKEKQNIELNKLSKNIKKISKIKANQISNAVTLDLSCDEYDSDEDYQEDKIINKYKRKVDQLSSQKNKLSEKYLKNKLQKQIYEQELAHNSELQYRKIIQDLQQSNSSLRNTLNQELQYRKLRL
ncbi:hypothetical protein PPERSA_07466 [Pseudocohnilembus persalinus]|uniref:Uncharacterized protein n=1 Tax=Pseudocohnilembus persalinus TaxID=266149 RepID=A0A0V0QAX5_PSEPJ|nr:hypothetical protein PPERSA_07466 [Pseudocohnilembus persalinus]|eukprot:KRW99223.1 hypothetical protein PPERSA_07466 [Pseudocohnilembus persalinus]